MTMEYLKLALIFFKIGLLSFGGGYSVLPLIEQYVIKDHGWLTYEQYTDIITLSEITPGPIALNAASFTGFTAAGFLGSVIATFACVLPSLIIVSTLAVLYIRFRSAPVFSSVLSMLRPAICAIIFSAFLTIALLAFFNVSDLAALASVKVNIPSILIFLAAFALLCTKKMSPIAVILLSGAVGLLVF